MESSVDVFLNLPEVTVVGRSQIEGYICLHLAILAKEIDCPHCGRLTKELLHNSLEQISREEGLTPEQVEGIFNSVSNSVKKKTGVK